MNKIRRKTLADIREKLTELHDLLEEVKDEEEVYRDNMPDNLQGSERYEKADEACGNLDSALTAIDEALEYIEYAEE
jgi:hypothetical protein